MELTVDEIVDYSVDYLYELFSENDSALHEKIVGLEFSIIEMFSLPFCIESRRLFKPTYWVLIRDYVLQEGFPNGNGDPQSKAHLWRLKKEGLPSKEEFKRMVLDGYEENGKKFRSYRINLEENLRLALQSSS